MRSCPVDEPVASLLEPSTSVNEAVRFQNVARETGQNAPFPIEASCSSDGSDCVEKLLSQTLTTFFEESSILELTPESYRRAMFWEGGEALMKAARAAGALGFALRSTSQLTHSVRGWVALVLLSPSELLPRLETHPAIRLHPALQPHLEALNTWANERKKTQALVRDRAKGFCERPDEFATILESLENLALGILFPTAALNLCWSSGFAVHERHLMQNALFLPAEQKKELFIQDRNPRS